MRIGKFASIVEYRMNEQFQNCRFRRQTFIFEIFKKFPVEKNIEDF